MYQRLSSLAGPMLLCLAGTVAMAQHADFPIQTPKDYKATEVAGIGSYHLVLEGDHAAVQSFDLEGRVYANCEIDWPEDSKSMVCTMLDGGRFKASWYASRAEFEDLYTNDHVSIEFGDVDSQEAAFSEPGEPQPGFHRSWTLRGTKNRDEIRRDWGTIMPFFAYLFAEVELTLGKIPGDQDTPLERMFSPLPPNNLIFCPDGTPFCNSQKKCRKSALGTTASSCCTTASNDADQCCKSLTGIGCCANSLCSVICPFGLYCDCFLDGWQADCSFCA